MCERARTALMLAAGLSAGLTISQASGQLVRGEWVEQADQRIAEHRTAPLRIIVQDAAGRPVPDLEVRIDQQAHAFVLGFETDGGDLDRLAGHEPLWRCFNAVSLQRINRWPDLQPNFDTEPDFDAVRRIVGRAAERGLTVRWGGVISADPGRNPDWLTTLDGPALRACLERYTRSVVDQFADRVGQFDLYTDSLDHDMIESRLGPAMLRNLYEHAKAHAPHAMFGARFEEALAGARINAMVRKLNAMRQQFIPVEVAAIQQRLGGIIVPGAVEHGLGWISRLDTPVVISGLEIGGEDPTSAAINLETMVRLLFAEPNVHAIYLGAIDAGHVADPNAALIDEHGEPTMSGEVIDRLFRETWWNADVHRTDELGNVYADVYLGRQRISATLPDGSIVETEVWVGKGDVPRVIVLEPIVPRPRPRN